MQLCTACCSPAVSPPLIPLLQRFSWQVLQPMLAKRQYEHIFCWSEGLRSGCCRAGHGPCLQPKRPRHAVRPKLQHVWGVQDAGCRLRPAQQSPSIRASQTAQHMIQSAPRAVRACPRCQTMCIGGDPAVHPNLQAGACAELPLPHPQACSGKLFHAGPGCHSSCKPALPGDWCCATPCPETSQLRSCR